jgi:hypothetical protein
MPKNGLKLDFCTRFLDLRDYGNASTIRNPAKLNDIAGPEACD